MNRGRRTLAVLTVLAICMVITPSAMAAIGNQVVTTYYGIVDPDGSTYCNDVGPTYPIMGVVGERIRWCDGSITSWGRTCNDYEVTYERCTREPVPYAAMECDTDAGAASNRGASNEQE